MMQWLLKAYKHWNIIRNKFHAKWENFLPCRCSLSHICGLSPPKVAWISRDFQNAKVASAKASATEGGETGIRTLGAIACTTVFETAPFSRSGISPEEQTYKNSQMQSIISRIIFCIHQVQSAPGNWSVQSYHSLKFSQIRRERDLSKTYANNLARSFLLAPR